MTDRLTVQVNGNTYCETCLPGTSLLTLLRNLGWVGVHQSCGTGDCGSCTVWLNGEPIHSCIYPVVRATGQEITTIEGLAQAEQLSPMQQAFLEKQGFQCGYCTPGMIMTAEKLEFATEADLLKGLEGNLCRCTGYEAILESIHHAKQNKEPPIHPFTPPPIHPSPQIGANIPKQDGFDIVTGKPAYTADFSPPGLLHLKVLRSPHPHARIHRINTAKAKAYPGVHAVFTHEDVPRRPYTTAGHAEPVPDPFDHFLLDQKVRFVGDRVAAVVADSPGIAELACQLIEVEYEILPYVTDPFVAMGKQQESTAASVPTVIHDEPEATQIYDRDRNIAGRVDLETGDVEAGFAAADLVIERTYQLPAVQHTHLEPHVSVSWLEADGTVVVRSSTQVPFHCQRILSEIFELPQDKIRVLKGKIGGGFGNKQEVLSEDLCVLATLRTGRPVKWEFTRQEELTATNSRHAMTIRLKTGVKRDGTIVAQDMEAVSNTGAYGNHGSTVVFITGCYPLGIYRCPNQRFLGLAVYTNTMPAGAFRGYGATQGCFAVEAQMDEIARTLGIDPIALRLKNIIGAETILKLGREGDYDHFHLVGSYALKECIEKVVEVIDYQPHQPSIVDRHLRRGIGFAISMQGSGIAKAHRAVARLTLLSNGQYELRTGAVDVGTGSDTTLRQVAAEVLTTQTSQILLVTGDTHQTPFDAGSYASGTAYISGQAVRFAAQQLRSHLLEFVATLWHCAIDELTLHRDAISTSHQTISLSDLAILASQQQHQFTAEAEHAADQSSLTFTAQAAEVEVDTETGRVRVLRCVQAIDLGTALNPRICRGQMTGGMVMGLGYALTEELVRDEQGRTLNAALRTYRIPSAKDIPQMDVLMIEKVDPYGPFGAKGVGEIGTNCTAPAIVNAVAHATGVHLTQLPLLPELVWWALQETNPIEC
jgi:putative selenate reductase molybdopterin-binding subunit